VQPANARGGVFVGGAAFVADLRAIPTNHLSVVQRQALDIAEYALWRKDVLRNTPSCGASGGTHGTH